MSGERKFFGDPRTDRTAIVVAVEQARLQDRRTSLSNLSTILPAEDLFGLFAGIRTTHPDFLLSPVRSMNKRQILSVSDESTEDYASMSSFYDMDGVQTGIGWNFEVVSNNNAKYEGVKALATPKHVFIVGAHVSAFEIPGRISEADRQAFLLAFSDMANQTPGTFKIPKNEIPLRATALNPKLR